MNWEGFMLNLIIVLGILGAIFLILLGFSVGSLFMVVMGSILSLVGLGYLIVKIIRKCYD